MGLSSSFPERGESVKEEIIKISGFGDPKKSEYPIPDEVVLNFLIETFGPEIIAEARIREIKKDPSYLIYVDVTTSEGAKKANELKQQVSAESDHGGIFIFKTEKDYLKAAMILEGVEKVEELEHLYKIRSFTPQVLPEEDITITVYSFGVERPEDFEYLRELPLSPEDKMRVYILSGLAHEVFHCVIKRVERARGLLRKYAEEVFLKGILQEELGDNVNVYDLVAQRLSDLEFVTPYVARYRDVYKADAGTIVEEDFAEAVRLSTANPDYLKEKFPERYNFIRTHMSWLRENTAFEAVKQYRESLGVLS